MSRKTNLNLFLRELYNHELQFSFRFDVEDVYILELDNNQITDDEIILINEFVDIMGIKVNELSHNLIVTISDKEDK